MKPTGFLHIGLQKTGTTSLQQFLFDNNGLLQQCGFYYPKSLGHVNHLYLAACNQAPHKIDDIRRSLGIVRSEDVLNLREETIKKMNIELQELTVSVKGLIMSNEHVHGRITRLSEVLALREFLTAFCDGIKVIVYLRRQDRLAASLYSTRFRAGSTELDPVFPETTSDFYDYGKILKEFSEVFGHENLIIRLFDRAELKGQDLFCDFSETIGLPIDSRFRRPAILNQPLKPEAIRFFAELNKHIPRFVDGQANPNFLPILNAFDSLFCGYGPVVDRARAKRFYEQFKEGNENVRQTFFSSRKIPLFDENFDEYPETLPNATYSYGDAVKISAEILKFMMQKIGKGRPGTQS